MKTNIPTSVPSKLSPSQISIAVVIPCYQECEHILSILDKIGDEVSAIYVVDDACPDQTGNLVRKNTKDRIVSI